MSLTKKIFAGLALALSVSFSGGAVAQGLFAPAVLVNDSVITEFEIDQRQRFLTALNAPGTSREVIVNALINERLQQQEMKNLGLTLTQNVIDDGKAEFAQRVNLTVEEFEQALESNGIAKETFTSFVAVGVAWREYIGSRFGPRLEVSEEDIDRALGSSSGASSIRVLISEIIIPAPEGETDDIRALAEEIATTTSFDTFSQYAREFSATATSQNGGRLPWQPLSDLPPILRPLLLGLAPGDVTEPLTIPNAVAVFQLRDIEETGAPQPQFASIEYATYFIPGGRTEAAFKRAAEVESKVDVCNDLYGIAKDQPPEVLERHTKAVADIPNDFAIELSKLDPGEVSTALTRSNGQTLVFLMLCGRTEAANEAVERATVAESLRSNRLNAIAESYLAQLRAGARIRTP